MEIMICEKGHRYDPSKYSSCPKCAESKGNGVANTGFVGGAPSSSGYNESINVFEPNSGMPPTDFMNSGGGMPPTDFMNSGGGMPPTDFMNNGGGGMPPTDFMDATKGMTRGNTSGIGLDESRHAYDDDSDSHTQVLGKYGTTGFTPVAGWLVCIDGADKGADYKIKDGYNYIGRSEHMDICIRNDATISRDKHALIAYDKKSKTFFVGPADGRNLIYLNDSLVMSPQIIKIYDRLNIGNTILMFVPLCGKEFD